MSGIFECAVWQPYLHALRALFSMTKFMYQKDYTEANSLANIKITHMINN